MVEFEAEEEAKNLEEGESVVNIDDADDPGPFIPPGNFHLKY